MSVVQSSATDVQSLAHRIATELRTHPEHWTQGEFARDAQGGKVDYRSPAAVCWCLHGFIRRELAVPIGGSTASEILSAFEQAAIGKPYIRDVSGLGFVAWQDEQGRTVADIIAVCDLVAASL